MAKEATLHRLMNASRIHKRREYFRVTLERVRELFDNLNGDMWVAPSIVNETKDEIHRRLPRVSKSMPIFTVVGQHPIDDSRPANFTCDRCGLYLSRNEFNHHLKSANKEECEAILSNISREALMDKYFNIPFQTDLDLFKC